MGEARIWYVVCRLQIEKKAGIGGSGNQDVDIRTAGNQGGKLIEYFFSGSAVKNKMKNKTSAGLRPEVLSTKLVLSEVEWIRNPKNYGGWIHEIKL